MTGGRVIISLVFLFVRSVFSSIFKYKFLFYLLVLRTKSTHIFALRCIAYTITHFQCAMVFVFVAPWYCLWTICELWKNIFCISFLLYWMWSTRFLLNATTIKIHLSESFRKCRMRVISIDRNFHFFFFSFFRLRLSFASLFTYIIFRSLIRSFAVFFIERALTLDACHGHEMTWWACDTTVTAHQR